MQQLTGKFSSLFNLSNLITSNIYFDLNPIFTYYRSSVTSLSQIIIPNQSRRILRIPKFQGFITNIYKCSSLKPGHDLKYLQIQKRICFATSSIYPYLATPTHTISSICGLIKKYFTYINVHIWQRLSNCIQIMDNNTSHKFFWFETKLHFYTQ